MLILKMLSKCKPLTITFLLASVLNLSLYSIQNSSSSIEESYLYNENETRIRKQSKDEVTFYVSKNYQSIFSNDKEAVSKSHIFANDQRIISKESDIINWNYSDFLGSASRVANREGSLISAFWYSPFGADADELGGVNVDFKFTDQEEDNTGHYYYGARYYNTTLGRFMAADSLLPNLFDPQKLNRFSYAKNNPTKFIDPTGHFEIVIVFPIWLYEDPKGAVSADTYDIFGKNDSRSPRQMPNYYTGDAKDERDARIKEIEDSNYYSEEKKKELIQKEWDNFLRVDDPDDDKNPNHSKWDPPKDKDHSARNAILSFAGAVGGILLLDQLFKTINGEEDIDRASTDNQDVEKESDNSKRKDIDPKNYFEVKR